MSSPLARMRAEWFGNVKNDVLAGLVVSFALIPEVIGFSIAAGVDPKVGLYASFCIAVTIAITGGRPGMISAAAGSVALLTPGLVHAHGAQYVIAASLLAGIIQIAAGCLRMGVLVRFVSRSVMTGFVNALAILIFSAQVPQLLGGGIEGYLMTALGLAIIYLLPRLTKAVPSSLICIVVLTAIALSTGMDLKTIGDMGQMPSELPYFVLPDVPFTFETLKIIAPYAVPMAMVGLLESMLTQNVVDEMTETRGQKNRECWGLGIANIVAGCFGGMAGCAMIGQTVVNVKSGGRGRLSCLMAGVFLLLLVVVFQDYARRIPMVALVAVMIMVSISTFDWGSFKALRTHPRVSSVVMLATVLVTVLTDDLSQGVIVGVLLSGVFFAFKVARLFKITSAFDPATSRRTYRVSGQIFFASADAFAEAIDTDEVLKSVVIDVSRAHFWDISAIGALDRIAEKLKRRGVEFRLEGLNEASAMMIDRVGTHAKAAGPPIV
ncbi:sulfate permease, SulP family [Arboricoccus pini]|uniref:Sulfate permease, SulP family n=1 Tax=Arboricoccus pini TaxID=1963835 RepID=A0A212RD73_9PROT|nr:SulP family inorganic anion transporter [Arboricoccus pini]SNB70219.1 sulfate permease, SulP family [Arboricoccus pini]